MAVRFDAPQGDSSGDRLALATGLADQSQYSVTCWFKLSVAQGGYRTVWSIGPTTDTGQQSDILQVNSSNVLIVWSQSARTLMPSPVVGTWYFVGLSFNNGTATYRVRALGDANFLSGTITTHTSHSHGRLYVGNSHYTNEPLNGCVEALKWWSTNLSGAELEAEATQRLPARTTNVRYYWKFTASTTTDDSGNGGNFTSRGTPTLEAGPAGLVDEVVSDVPKALSESGTGVEALSVAASAPVTDAGMSSEALTAQASTPLADAGQALEALALSVEAVLAESAQATDALEIHQDRELEDTGTSDERLNVFAASPLQETGTSEETFSIEVILSLGEEGSHDDSITSGSLVSVSETAISSESLEVLSETSLSETAASEEDLAVSVSTFFEESGTSEEVLDFISGTPLMESGSADETLLVSVEVALNDSASAVEQLFEEVALVLNESAQSSESIFQGAFKSLSEEGTSQESLAVSVSLSLSETAFSDASLSATAVLVFEDSATAVEEFLNSGSRPTRGIMIPSRDVGSGPEAMRNYRPVPMMERAVRARPDISENARRGTDAH